MDAVSAEVPARRKGFLDRFLPLRHWLGAEASGGIEMGQAKTRLICTLVGVGGFVVMGRLGMVWNLSASPYWQDNSLFGATIIFGLIANTVNASILLERIAGASRLLAEKIEEVSRLAWQDQLTKLPNRPFFRERLAQMVAAAARSGRQVALLLFDIDGFKSVNDTLGHEAGDRLLQEIAERVGRRGRQADTFARVGGDEFVILMDIAHDKSDAIPVAETVVSAISEIDMFAEQRLRVSASVGIACSGPNAAGERIADEF